jgi:hypothetical protein
LIPLSRPENSDASKGILRHCLSTGVWWLIEGVPQGQPETAETSWVTVPWASEEAAVAGLASLSDAGSCEFNSMVTAEVLIKPPTKPCPKALGILPRSRSRTSQTDPSR